MLIMVYIITNGEPEFYFKPLRSQKNFVSFIVFISNNFLIYLVNLIYILILIHSIQIKKYNTIIFVICFIIGQLLFALICVHALKRILGAPRPYTGETDWHYFTGRSRYHSMPSGHTTEITGLTGSLSQFKGSYLTAFLWGLLPALVGFSRLYVGMHHAIDIVAGAILGSLCSLFVTWAYNNPNFGRSWKQKLKASLKIPT
jgi:undecaprenyl-diphosphatase